MKRVEDGVCRKGKALLGVFGTLFKVILSFVVDSSLANLRLRVRLGVIARVIDEEVSA